MVTLQNSCLQMRNKSSTMCIVSPKECPIHCMVFSVCFTESLRLCNILVSVLFRALGHSEAVARRHPSDPEGFPAPGGPLHCRRPQNGLPWDYHARCKLNPFITPNPCALLLSLCCGCCVLHLLSSCTCFYTLQVLILQTKFMEIN